MNKFSMLAGDDDVSSRGHARSERKKKGNVDISVRETKYATADLSSGDLEEDGFEQPKSRGKKSSRGGRGGGFTDRDTNYQDDRGGRGGGRGGFSPRGGRGGGGRGRGDSDGRDSRGGGYDSGQSFQRGPPRHLVPESAKVPKPNRAREGVTETQLGSNLYFASTWKVYNHLLNSGHDEKDYNQIWTIDNISNFWQFFNNFQLLDRETFQFYVMREDIKPIREDNANRRGGNFSLKLEFHSNRFSTVAGIDLGILAMTCLTMLMVNETLISKDASKDQAINGISYMIRNNNTYIKIWYKEYDENVENVMPRTFFSELENELAKHDRNRGQSQKQYIMYKNIEIHPEY